MKADLNQRFGDIDLLRFFGIVLMIMGHIWFGQTFDKWIHAFHMPLWFIISGFFSNTDRSIKEYLVKKLKALILPYVSFSLLYEIVYSFGGGKQWLGLIFPNSIEVPLNGALWFLPALFFVDTVCFIILKLLGNTPGSILIALLSTAGFFIPMQLPFSFDSALVGMGFYLLGRYVKKYDTKLQHMINLPIAMVLLLGFSAISIFVNEYVNLRTKTYSIFPLFWIDALVITYALLVIARWLDSKLDLPLMKEIGKESLIYVCTNQFILFLLSFIPIPHIHPAVTVAWKMTELVIVVTVCFAMNRALKKSAFRFLLGKG